MRNSPQICRLLLVGGIAALAGMISGCGNRGPQVQIVLGRATLDGEPLAAATVTFVPVGRGTTGLAAVGMTREDGSFRLTAVRGGPPERGTTTGDYAVTFMKVAHDPPGKEPAAAKPAAPAQPQSSATTASGALPVFFIVPEGYGSRETCGLRATVRQGVNQGPEFTFDLRSDFRGE